MKNEELRNEDPRYRLRTFDVVCSALFQFFILHSQFFIQIAPHKALGCDGGQEHAPDGPIQHQPDRVAAALDGAGELFPIRSVGVQGDDHVLASDPRAECTAASMRTVYGSGRFV